MFKFKHFLIRFFYMSVNIVCILLCVAYFTLMERLIIGAMQRRIGPKKVGFFGLLQPLVDGGKLFFKVFIRFLVFIKKISVFSFFFMFLLMIVSWIVLGFKFSYFLVNFKLIVFLCLRSLAVYFLFVIGWSSTKKYALLGSYRGIVQRISYEVSFMFLFIVPCYYRGTFNLQRFNKSVNIGIFWFFWVFCILWLIIILGERHRTPFDFAEGERELVSGYKIEYGSLRFIFLFLTEYGKILLMCYLRSYFFFSRPYFRIFILFFFIWTRATFPRYRFDLYMEFSWKFVLPLSIFSIFFIL